MENSEQPKKVSKYASQIAYDKKRKEIDPEYRKKKSLVSSKCALNRRNNDPEYKAKYNEYMKNYMSKVRENHRQFVALQKMQNLQLKDKLE